MTRNRPFLAGMPRLRDEHDRRMARLVRELQTAGSHSKPAETAQDVPDNQPEGEGTQ